jgi:hypothetical protein
MLKRRIMREEIDLHHQKDRNGVKERFDKMLNIYINESFDDYKQID